MGYAEGLLTADDALGTSYTVAEMRGKGAGRAFARLGDGVGARAGAGAFAGAATIAAAAAVAAAAVATRARERREERDGAGGALRAPLVGNAEEDRYGSMV